MCKKCAINCANLSDKITKINELVKDELGRLIGLEINFGQTLISVSKVEITKNRQEARVFLSIYPLQQNKKVLELLNGKKAFLRRQLATRIYMRPLPAIRFLVDESQEKAGFIDNLIRQSKKNERE